MVIGAWGDSITYGRCDTEGLGWPGRVLRELYSKDESIHLYNRGVCGDTSSDLLQRFENELQSLKPDVVLVSIGVNDSKIPAGSSTNLVSIEEYSRNLSELIKLARMRTDRVMLIGLTNMQDITTSHESNFSDSLARPYEEVASSTAAREGVPFIALFGMLDTAMDLADGLHPNVRGYEKIAAKIVAAIEF